MSESDPTYVLGQSDEEHQRLQQQAALLRPMTERFFRTAGLSPGMRVLDIGSGAGDVAFLAADIVGPGGQVVGVDMDGRALETARDRAQRLGLAQVSFFEGDVRTLPLEDQFDAVIGRLVLLYMANPAEGLAGVSARVRSGGLVAFQEMDMDRDVIARTFPPDNDALWNQTGRAIVETFTRAGVHARMGRKLMQTFLDAGLPAPRFMDETSIGGGPEYAGYSWLANTLASLVPMAAKLGVDHPATDGLGARIRDDAVARRLLRVDAVAGRRVGYQALTLVTGRRRPLPARQTRLVPRQLRSHNFEVPPRVRPSRLHRTGIGPRLRRRGGPPR